tara:strand:+ start:700 stop:1572 length:873 start_codon:yes stop_codon:yes gene_type:complete
MAEEQQVELDLDGAEETVIDTEAEDTPQDPEPAPSVEVSSDSEQDEFQKAESNTQKRIDRLTKKMREAQRREEEALRYAKSVQEEAEGLKKRMDNLDTHYVNEYESRVTTQMTQAETDLARAMELGDTQAAVEANKKIASLSIENDRLSQAKLQQEQRSQVVEQPQQVQQQPQQMRRPDPKAEDWAQRNDWFGQDEAMTFAAFGIHKRLVENEGFDPNTDEYYTELDRRINEKFNMPVKNTGKRPAQTVAGVSRSSGRSSGKKVRLTPSQVAIAKKLGVPLEAYAKHVKE